ncbi:MAG: hypothetical protein ABJH68_15415 [Ilumatobacter sp.]|uniref:hypothetical protein n=1 Tax=Ilumatobacter sp. TaxID=1967498 RepID=UPI00329A050F
MKPSQALLLIVAMLSSCTGSDEVADVDRTSLATDSTSDATVQPEPELPEATPGSLDTGDDGGEPEQDVL